MTKMAQIMTLWMVGVVGVAGTGSVTHLRSDNTYDSNNNNNNLVVLQSRFADWMRDYQKEYKSMEEREHRFEIWMENHGTFSALSL
jgi:hypothetical protein